MEKSEHTNRGEVKAFLMENMQDQITVKCENCGKEYSVSRELIGKRGKCLCGHVKVVAEEVLFSLPNLGMSS